MSLFESFGGYVAGVVAIVIWRTQVYESLQSSQSTNGVKAYSAAFFALFAIVYFTAFIPIVKQLFLTSSEDSTVNASYR